jgi:hypothetical protein
MSKFIRAAKTAVAAFLEAKTEPVLLFTVSSVADRAAYNAGKKRELFPSLYDYEPLAPAGWTGHWLTSGKGTDSLYCLVPPGWTTGTTRAPNISLLLEGGPAREATLAEVGD